MPADPNPHAASRRAALRPLGATEDMYWRFDSVCPLYFGVIAGFEGVLDMNALSKAWSAVRRRHPLLRAAIQPLEDETPWYVDSGEEMQLEVIEATPDEAWGLLERSLVTPFDTAAGPLVRCLVLEHGPSAFSLVTTYHHAISDGRSATFVLRDLMKSLAQQAAGDSAELEPLALMDYYGDRIRTMQSYSSFAHFRETVSKTWSAAWRFLSRVGVPRGLSRTEDVPLSEQTLLIEPRTVDAEVMRAVIAQAKAQRVTVQCVLNAALSMAVADDRPMGRLEATTCTQVLDVRARLIPPVGEDCGLFATGNTSMHRIGPNTDFWALARDIRVGLQEALETPLPFFHPATHKSYASIARLVGRARAEEFSELISRIHPEGLCVSNLGRVEISVPGSPVAMTSFAFATNTNVLNSFNTSAATCGGRMVWSFSASSTIGREKLSEVADRAIGFVLQAGDAASA